MSTIDVEIIEVAHGGTAVARGPQGRAIFVPFALPGEKVRISLENEKQRYAHARLEAVLEPAPERITPRCRHFGTCGGCHWQQVDYPLQLEFKERIIRDQMTRIGGFDDIPLAPILPNPQPWAYGAEMVFSPTDAGEIGFWSPVERRVIPIEMCPISHPDLVTLLQDIDLTLPGLRTLSLRRGDDEALLAAIEVDGVEPPDLEADFPVSVAIVLPDKTAASLVGDNYTVQQVKGRDFRVSPGCYLAPSPAAMGLVVDTVVRQAALRGTERVLELYSGVGTLTAFLAPDAAELVAVERNGDAAADTAVNLEEFENVTLYQDWAENVLPLIQQDVDLLLMHPDERGISKQVQDEVARIRPSRIILVAEELAITARDGKRLRKGGYQLKEIQPVDMRPQTYHILTVSLWELP